MLFLKIRHSCMAILESLWFIVYGLWTLVQKNLYKPLTLNHKPSLTL